MPDPTGGDQRIYLSGDMGRLLPDGSLEHWGRKDQMVKIRGYRVEPLEVERALRQLDQVQEAVVVAREREPGTQELVAFIVPADSTEISPIHLRRALAMFVPDYMFPARFVRLDQWPLTASSKIDRQALCRMALPPPAPAETYSAPRDGLERQLVDLWEAVLKVHPIGLQDNFFDLGGHSLTARALMTQVARATGKKLPLTALFHAPTVEQLAALLRHDSAGRLTPTAVVPLQPLGNRPPLFVVPELETSALNLVKLIRYIGVEFPVYGLHPRGFDDGLPPHTSVPEAAAYYVQAIRAVQPTGPYLLAGLCYGGIVAFKMAQQLLGQGETVPLLALIDVQDVTLQPTTRPAQVRCWLTYAYSRWHGWHGYTRERLGVALHRWRPPTRSAVPTDSTARLRPTRRLRYVQRLAYMRYRALPYAGPISLLMSEEYQQQNLMASWSRVAPTSLETQVVPNATHRQLLSEATYFRLLARWLVERVERSTVSSPRPVALTR